MRNFWRISLNRWNRTRATQRNFLSVDDHLRRFASPTNHRNLWLLTGHVHYIIKRFTALFAEHQKLTFESFIHSLQHRLTANYLKRLTKEFRQTWSIRAEITNYIFAFESLVDLQTSLLRQPIKFHCASMT